MYGIITLVSEPMTNIQHPNIVELFAYNLKAKYVERDAILLAMEYILDGELFDILYYTNASPGILAQTYFRQLLSGVEALHNRHIDHRDLKPQNLLLGRKYILKISDFGSSKIMQLCDDGMLRSYGVGTRGYQAPEIILNKPYTSSCDICMCLILFLVLTGYPPFQSHGKIARGKAKKFWKQHCRCDLLTRMLAFDPNQHVTLNDIAKSNQDLQKVLQLRHTQMEIKRANDPVQRQISIASKSFVDQMIIQKN